MAKRGAKVAHGERGLKQTEPSRKNKGKKGGKGGAKLNACGVTAQLLKKLTQIRHKSNNALSDIDWT